MVSEDIDVAPIRNAVRALVVSGEAVLIQQKTYEDGSERYCLPGGSPHPGETLLQALQRECAEEIGCVIDVLDLLHVADFYKPGRDDPTQRHPHCWILYLDQGPKE
jgi:8-oxo-dGTP diphosphatase